MLFTHWVIVYKNDVDSTIKEIIEMLCDDFFSNLVNKEISEVEKIPAYDPAVKYTIYNKQ